MLSLDFYHAEKPILGICLGHQAIGAYFGARVSRARLPMHGKTSTLIHNGQGLFSDLPSTLQVMRYHSLLVENLEYTPLEVTATTPEGEVMAIAHQNLPLMGVQFHPESILTEYGLEMMRNWLKSIKKKLMT